MPTEFARKPPNSWLFALQFKCVCLLGRDFASAGYEVVARMVKFWDWFRYAVNEMIEWHEAVSLIVWVDLRFSPHRGMFFKRQWGRGHRFE